MPRVPTLDTPQVASQGLPVPRLSGASPADFGAGLGDGIRTASGALRQFAEEQRDKADTLRLIEFQSQLDATEHDLVVNGAMARRGKDALGVYDDTLKAWDGATGELVSGLSGSRQKDAAAQMVARRRSAIGNTLESHTRREVAQYEAQTAKDGIQSAGDLAISYATDPTRREQAIAQGEGVIRATSATNGMDPEGALAEFRSNVHAGVIGRLLANDQDQAAAAYLTEYKGEIQGSALARLENAVQDGSTLGTALRETDRIMGAAPDRASAQEMVRAIEDPKVRQTAQSEVNQRFAEQAAAAREREDALFQSASDQLEQNGGSLNRLKVSMGGTWLDLDHNSREALKSASERAQAKARGEAMETNLAVWTDFALMSPEDKANLDPKRLMPYLDEPDYQAAVKEIRDLRNNPGKSVTIGEQDRQVLTAARGFNLVPTVGSANTWNSEQQARYANLHRAFNREVAAFESAKGRSPTPVESQEMVDGLMKVRLRVSNGWFDKATTLPVPSLTDKDIEALDDDQVGQVQVPSDEYDALFNQLRSYGADRATRKNVVRLWLAAQRGDVTVGEELLAR